MDLPVTGPYGSVGGRPSGLLPSSPVCPAVRKLSCPRLPSLPLWHTDERAEAFHTQLKSHALPRQSSVT